MRTGKKNDIEFVGGINSGKKFLISSLSKEVRK